MDLLLGNPLSNSIVYILQYIFLLVVLTSFIEFKNTIDFLVQIYKQINKILITTVLVITLVVQS